MGLIYELFALIFYYCSLREKGVSHFFGAVIKMFYFSEKTFR